VSYSFLRKNEKFCSGHSIKKVLNTMDELKISIVTVVKNRAGTIARAIESVLDQNYTNLEYIIIDGNSDDGTAEIIREYSGRITRWVSESDKGATDALNKGFSMATGDIFAFLNADDFFEPGILTKVNTAFHDHPETDVVHGCLRYHNLGMDETFLCKPFKKTDSEIYHNIYTWPSVYVITFFMRREIFLLSGSGCLVYDRASDFEIYLNLLRAGAKFLFLDDIVLNHSSGGRSDRDVKGYFEVRDISIKYGRGKLAADINLAWRIFERFAGGFLLRLGFRWLRNLYAAMFYPDIKIVKN
jgi:glycosyltransferase involved in cell wall biosynthesis